MDQHILFLYCNDMNFLEIRENYIWPLRRKLTGTMSSTEIFLARLEVTPCFILILFLLFTFILKYIGFLGVCLFVVCCCCCSLFCFVLFFFLSFKNNFSFQLLILDFS